MPAVNKGIKGSFGAGFGKVFGEGGVGFGNAMSKSGSALENMTGVGKQGAADVLAFRSGIRTSGMIAGGAMAGLGALDMPNENRGWLGVGMQMGVGAGVLSIAKGIRHPGSLSRSVAGAAKNNVSSEMARGMRGRGFKSGYPR